MVQGGEVHEDVFKVQHIITPRERNNMKKLSSHRAGLMSHPKMKPRYQLAAGLNIENTVTVCPYRSVSLKLCKHVNLLIVKVPMVQDSKLDDRAAA